jgi:3-phenylpropionate/trans-cinnamate dioxygenase ferredoxin component
MEQLIARLSEFGEKRMISKKVGEKLVVLFLHDDGTVSSLEDRCSHADVKLSKGLFEEGQIECPAHGARFDARTGAPLCMPAVSAVRGYPIRIVEDEIWITL